MIKAEEVERLERMADDVVATSQAWVRNPVAQCLPLGEDREFTQLDAARDSVRRLKYNLLRPLDADSRMTLTRRHAVWIVEYDLTLAAVVAMDPSDEVAPGHVGLACRLTAPDAGRLTTFFWCGGALLRINTADVQAARSPHCEGMLPEELAQAVNGRSWEFAGTRWLCPDGVLILDLGHRPENVAAFLEAWKQECGG